jgi:hypothetical protein
MKNSSNNNPQLDDFALMLQEAHPNPSLSEDFDQQLFDAIESVPPLRNVFQQSLFMRVAAALLLVCMLGVPAAAFMGIIQLSAPKPPVLSFMPATTIDDLNVDIQAIEPENVVVPPVDEYLNDPLYQKTVSALSAQNSFRLLLQPLPNEFQAKIIDFFDELSAVMADSKLNR